MSDDTYTAHAAELDESVDTDKVVLFAFDEAADKLEQAGEFEPFTVVLHGENLHVESHPGDDAIECFNSAATAVKTLEHVMSNYVFAYDGYVETDEGTNDAIIVERGKPGDETAQVFAILYSIDEEGEGTLEFEEGIYDLGPASSLLEGVPVTDEDLDEI